MSHGKFKVEHFNKDGNLIGTIDAHNDLDATMFNQLFKVQYTDSNKTLFNKSGTHFVHREIRDELTYDWIRSLQPNTSKIDEAFKFKKIVNRIDDFYPRDIIESRFTVTPEWYYDNKINMVLLTESGLNAYNKAKENKQVEYVYHYSENVANFLFSASKENIRFNRDYNTLSEKDTILNEFSCYSESDNPAYDSNKHFILTPLSKIIDVSESIEFKEVEATDTDFIIRYKLTLVNEFVNNCSTTLPIKAVSLIFPEFYENNINYTFPFRFDRVYDEKNPRKVINYKNTSRHKIASIGEFDRIINTGDIVKVSYDLTFEFYMPRKTLESTIELPNKLFPYIDEPVNVKMNFIKQEDSYLDDTTKTKFSDFNFFYNYTFNRSDFFNLDNPSNNFGIQCYITQDKFDSIKSQKTADKLFNYFTQDKFDNFKISDYIKNYNSQTFNHNNNNKFVISYPDKKETEIFNLVYFENHINNIAHRFEPSIRLFDVNIQDGYSTLNNKVLYGVIINSLYPATSNRTWYNWLVLFDKPIHISEDIEKDLTRSGGRFDFSMVIPLPNLTFFHDIENPSSLESIEANSYITNLTDFRY